MIRAKLFVSSVERQSSTPDAVKVTLAAVTRGEENKTWAEATPAATFSMQIQNPDAVAAFELGQEFYVDFTPAEPTANLADGHPYQPSDYELENGDKYGSARCAKCSAKRKSHDEPLRSRLVKLAGLGA